MLNGVYGEDAFTRYSTSFANTTVDYVWWLASVDSIFTTSSFNVVASPALDMMMSDHAVL